MSFENLNSEDQLTITLAMRDIVETTMDVDNINSISEVKTNVLNIVNSFFDGLESEYRSVEEALSEGLLLYDIDKDVE